MRLAQLASPVVGAALAAVAVGACSADPPAAAAPTAPGPRIIREDQMPAYIAAVRKLWADTDASLAWAWDNDPTSQHNAELTGRQECAVIIAGIAPRNAYAAAYPRVADAGNVDELEQRDGELAAQHLCPPT